MKSGEGKFEHRQMAHCESGVTSSLLQNAGIPFSEAMSFGIGSGIFFVHLPFVKVMELPLTSYRSYPGLIFKKTCRRLGIPFEYRQFRDPIQGTRALDEYLAHRQPVGLRSNIFWLPYIPEAFRFQFNAHHLVVYGKADDQSYLISDPVLEEVSICPARALTKGRFSKGMLAPKGLIFFPKPQAFKVEDLPLDKAIREGLRETVNAMLFTPLPMTGIKGIRYLAGRMQKWPKKHRDPEQLKLNIANVVRMQEEIGTGGAGFRFLYASFLQEAGERLNSTVLTGAAQNLTETGNAWREFATLAAKFCKDRLEVSYDEIPKSLRKIADLEKAVFTDLRRNYLARH